jgi:hypothetical protein
MYDTQTRNRIIDWISKILVWGSIRCRAEDQTGFTVFARSEIFGVEVEMRNFPYAMIIMTIWKTVLGLAFFVPRSVESFETPVGDGCIYIKNPSLSYEENTKRIQYALDVASTDGQGCVSVGSGEYPVLRLMVKSNTKFILQAETKLVNVINKTLVSIVQVGPNVENVTLEGPGTLYGNAEQGWDYWSAYDNRMTPYNDDGSAPRTHCLYIVNSRNVVVRGGLNLHNATDWTFRMDNSSNIFVDDVDIYGDSRFPNNDGFDPQSCQNVTLINSRIDVADDGVCPKADASMGPLTNLYVKNVTIRSKSHAIKFGSNTDTLMSNIIFDNITIWDSNGGLSIQQRSQGDIRNVTWSNINIETRYEAARWWGNGEWLGITNSPRNEPCGTIRDMKFINISGRSENGGLLSGLSGGISDITFENIHIKIATWSNYSSGPEPCCANGPICVGDMCVPHPYQTGARILCMGTRDYRPSPALPSGRECPVGIGRGHERTPSKADGIFLENAHHIVFKQNVVFEFESPRKDWFGDCVSIDRHSSHVTGVEDIKCINGP